jgi:hypothetical protein
MKHSSTSYQKALEDGLILRTAANADDVERVAAFNAKIHGEVAGSLARHLFLHHPHTSLDDLIFVEDKQSDQARHCTYEIPRFARNDA